METPAKQSVRTHLVSDSEAGQRLDNFLLRELKGVPKSHVYRIVRDGQVRVNGGRSRPATRISGGDRIRIPPVRTSIRGKSPGAVGESSFQPPRLFEDQDILIIDKPAGIAVHGGTGQRVSVIEQLRLGTSGYLELVHRLDKETSGILILAKNVETLRKMHNSLRRPGQESGVSKSYQTLLAGRWRGGVRTLHHRLETVRGRGATKRSRVTSTGREACSIFHPVAVFHDHSLVRVELKTGRLHQIRAHAHAVGLPVAGDRVYGDALKTRRFREFGLCRQFLHAERVCFLHPRTGKSVDVHSPLPRDLEAVLDNLRARRIDEAD